MINLSYTVAGQLIEPASVPQYLVADTVGVYQVVITFDSDWADMSEKKVVFRNPQVIDPDYRDVPVEFPLDANGQALVPAALLDPGKLFIGVYGTNSTQQFPTIWAPPLQVVPGASPGVEPSDDPALGTVIRTIPQTLTEEEKAQARENIGANEIEGGTAGNVVIIDNNENIEDSGISKDNLILAPQLSSRIYAEDQTPYLYRQTGGGVEAGTREYDSIVGGSVVSNQLIQNSTFTSTNTDTRTYVMIVIRLAKSPYTIALPATDVTTIGVFNRIFASTFDGQGQIIHGGRSANQYYCNEPNFVLVNGHKYLLSMDFTGIDISTVGGVTIKDMFCIDLTQMFSTAVADRLYAMETAQPGSGIALLKRMFPDDTYAYTAEPSLLSAMPTAHKMTDADGNVIGNYPLAGIELRGVWVVNSDGSISCDGDTYAPDGTVTRRYGIVDLGTLTWNLATDNQYNVFWVATADISPRAAYPDGVISCISDLYTAVTNKGVSPFANGSTSVNKSVAISSTGTTGRILVRDDSYTDVASFQTAVSGHYLIYRILTPTVETATPYESLQICDPLGTEEYVDERSVPVPVGHVTKYPVDQVAKLDGLPSNFSRIIAPTEKDFQATQPYLINRLLIVKNVLYKTITAISNGATLTVGTNIRETTLDEVIASL